ncbi:hypothetical protein CMO93_05680 [Candidatus Woesearchaeota archaeon]|nr:hypothetical protein [Candidatus Woesearchaeota archaeon]|tara:strand:+ start:4067 stop:7312 length:3246 start_codon:yes stop_codon:yes gene_type:complete
MKKVFLLMVFIIFLLDIGIVFSQNNDVNENKIDKEIEYLLEEQEEVSVIVVLEDDYETLDDYSVSELNEKSDLEKKRIMVEEQQEEVLSELDLKEEENQDNDFEFDLESKFSVVNGFAGNVTEEGLQKLASDPNVKKIYPNRPVKAFLSDSKNIVNASNTWSLIYNGTNITGKGEVVCVIDTGVDYTHSDMGNCASTSNINDGSCSKVIGGYDFINNDQNPIDDHGHGTHVAGIVASTNGIYKGIAPDANIIAIKSLNSVGSGTTQNVIDGIDWCVNNASIFNITVISMSLGGSILYTGHCDDSDSLTAAAIDAAIAKNISVIAATGNADSTTGIASPACIKNITSAGGVDKSDGMDFNRNNLTDLLAPGVNIVSLNLGGSFQTFSGTSFSTPMVTGAFALIHQYIKLTDNRNATPSEIENVLNDTGKRITDTSGSGLTFSRINILAALDFLDNKGPIITITSPSNNAVKTALTVNVTASEVLSNAVLEINNQNFSMSGSGLKRSLNVKSLWNGSFNYRIYGDDRFGNTGISETFTVNINLSSDNLTSLVLTLNEAEKQQATNVAVNQTTFGGIDFGSSILNFSGITALENAFNISNNLVSVDTNNFPGLNKSAFIVMKGLNFTKAPLIFTSSGFESTANEVQCSSTTCTGITYDATNKILRFNVAHFTSFFGKTNTTNGAPIITSTAVTSGTLTNQYSYDVDATDPDGDTLNFSLTTAPSGMSINAASGLITFIPSSIGNFNVIVQASDGNLTDSQSYQLTVTNAKINKLSISDLDVKIGSKSDKNVKNNTKLKDAEPGDKVEFNIELKNLFTEDEDLKIKNVEVEITIEEIDDGEDLDEDANDVDIKPSKKEEVKIEFDVPLDVEENTFDVLINIEGEDENGTTQEIFFKLELEVEKKKHEIRVISASTLPPTIGCKRTFSVNSEIINTGSDDEDEVTLEVLSAELGISDITKNIELDEGTEDNRFTKSISVSVNDDVSPGIYPITVNTYYDSKLSDTEKVEINVQACEQTKEIRAQVSGQGTQFSDGGVVVLQTVTQATVQESFMETDEYLTLLAILVIIFIGTAIFVTGAAFIVLKK